MDQFFQKSGFPCVNSLSFSLSLPLLFRLIPWNTEALRVHFSAQASKKQEGAQGRTPSAIQAGASGLREQSKPLVLRLY